MRISRRTSGGRGEYEISEQSPEGYMPNNLVDCRLFLDMGQGLVFDTGTELRHAQGKFRIRMVTQDSDMQLHRQLVVALLLPEAVRADNTMRGGYPIIQKGRYAIETINLEAVQLDGKRAFLRVSEVIIANTDHTAEELHLHSRVANLIRLWEARSKLPQDIQELLGRHEELVRGGRPLHHESEQVIVSLQALLSDQANDLGIAYNEYTDSLPALLELLEVQIAEPEGRVDDIEPEQAELRRRTIREWKKWAAHRGTASANFRRRVRAAYDSTCLVCGKRFPPTAHNRVPGVDAAHVLPWADYDLDRVDNGLCLCKLCHWAFDESIILIRHDGSRYAMEVSSLARQIIIESRPDFSLDVFEKLAGPISLDRLPQARNEWPNPQFLTELLRVLEE
ncbi:MAG: HNH endonuclease [Planctomycetes bacterium]|nr:HNH endonuclease [Planctomycetota bacterium]